MSRSPNPNHCGVAPYALSSSFTANVSPARPQPCSSLMPPPRVYITVSRSGQIRSPNKVMSSPVLPTTVTSLLTVESPSSADSAMSKPRRNRAPPMPPASATTRRTAPGSRRRRAPGSRRRTAPGSPGRPAAKSREVEPAKPPAPSMSPDSGTGTGTGRKAPAPWVDLPSEAPIQRATSAKGGLHRSRLPATADILCEGISPFGLTSG